MLPGRLFKNALHRFEGQRVRNDVLDTFRSVFRILHVPSRDDIDELDDRLCELEEIIDDLQARVSAHLNRIQGSQNTQEEPSA